MKVSAVLLSLAAVAIARPRPVPTTWSHEDIVDKTAAGLRLLQLGPDQTPVWFSEEAKLELMRSEIRFVDVTETYEDKLALKAVVAEAKAAAPKVSCAGLPTLAVCGTLTTARSPDAVAPDGR